MRDAARQAETLEIAVNYGQEWTLRDLRFAIESTLPAKEIAKRLGRTYHAVKLVRARNGKREQQPAPNARRQWTGPELEVANRRDLTQEAAAQILGRTTRAVQAARWATKTDPRKQNLAGIK